MSEKEENMMETFAQIIPRLTEKQKMYLLGYGEGIVAARKEAHEEWRKEDIGVQKELLTRR